MELIADLRNFPAAEALQWVASVRFDGRLVFQRRRLTVTLSLERGRIVECESNDLLASFGQHLFARGLADGLDLATARQRAEPKRIGAALVEMNVLNQDQLGAALAQHTLDLACSVVPWEDGVVAAHATALRPLVDPERAPLETLFVAMEAARRLDELERIREVIPHDNVELAPGEGDALDEPTPAQKRILDLLEASQMVDDLYARIGGCRFSLLKSIAGLIALDQVVCVSIGPAPRPAERNRVSLVDVLLDSDLDRRLRA